MAAHAAKFLNIVTAVYSAMLRDKKARFHKADRGLWTLTDAGKAEADAIRQAFAGK
jgi:hypothetical protein